MSEDRLECRLCTMELDKATAYIAFEDRTLRKECVICCPCKMSTMVEVYFNKSDGVNYLVIR